MIYSEKLQISNSEKQRIEKAVKKLKHEAHKKVDDLFHNLHDEVFEKIDCLQCANCCKTTSPIFRDVDIKRLAKHFRMKDQQFISTYLKLDEDGDHVLQTSPCPFLMDDNYCSVYDQRPNACKEYPHTDRKKVQAILNLTHKNAEICPAVADIFRGIIKAVKI